MCLIYNLLESNLYMTHHLLLILEIWWIWECFCVSCTKDWVVWNYVLFNSLLRPFKCSVCSFLISRNSRWHSVILEDLIVLFSYNEFWIYIIQAMVLCTITHITHTNQEKAGIGGQWKAHHKVKLHGLILLGQNSKKNVQNSF